MKVYEYLCEYNIEICEVCSEILKPKEEVESVLKVLEGRCLSYNEGWWSYEICYGGR